MGRSFRDQGVMSDGHVLADIRNMPRHSLASGQYITIKTTNTSSTASNASTFFDTMAMVGASITALGTETHFTLCDIVGSGVVGNVISLGSSYPMFQITIDGVEYLHTSYADTGGYGRIVLGYLLTGTPVVSTAINDGKNHISAIGSYHDPGFWWLTHDKGYARHGGWVAYRYMLPVSDLLTRGLPVLRFAKSLKIVMVQANYTAVNAADRCGVTYLLDA